MQGHLTATHRFLLRKGAWNSILPRGIEACCKLPAGGCRLHGKFQVECDDGETSPSDRSIISLFSSRQRSDHRAKFFTRYSGIENFIVIKVNHDHNVSGEHLTHVRPIGDDNGVDRLLQEKRRAFKFSLSRKFELSDKSIAALTRWCALQSISVPRIGATATPIALGWRR
jgi:hypothetical protein